MSKGRIVKSHIMVWNTLVDIDRSNDKSGRTKQILDLRECMRYRGILSLRPCKLPSTVKRDIERIAHRGFAYGTRGNGLLWANMIAAEHNPRFMFGFISRERMVVHLPFCSRPEAVGLFHDLRTLGGVTGKFRNASDIALHKSEFGYYISGGINYTKKGPTATSQLQEVRAYVEDMLKYSRQQRKDVMVELLNSDKEIEIFFDTDRDFRAYKWTRQPDGKWAKHRKLTYD